MIPAKLKAGDEVRVVSPAVSLGFIPPEQRQLAEERWKELGLRVSYSPNGEILDRFDSSPVEARVSDLHGANVDWETLTQIIRSKPELDPVPVIANASFGHTTPAFTFPIGGTCALRAHAGDVELRIETH